LTVWEGRILAALAESYPVSAAARGGRELRLRRDSIFPDFDTASPDERESFLEAAEALEASGLVRLQWQGRAGEVLRALVLLDPQALFLRLGRCSPAEEAEAARAEALQQVSELVAIGSEAGRRGTGSGQTGTGRAFFDYLSTCLEPRDAAAGIDARAVADLGRLFSFLSDPVPGLTPRALSIRLYADSKRLERLLGLFRPVLQKAGREGVMLPDLSALERSFPETQVAGRLVFETGATGTVDNGTGLVLGLPWKTARQLTRIHTLENRRYPRALGVENKESFHALAEGHPGFDCVFYTAGHPNPAVATLVASLARSGFELFHAGDLDPDGILILQELGDAAECKVTPLKMDTDTFDRYRAYGRNLDGTIMDRVSRISAPVMDLPGIRGLVERILSTGVGVEQEIIDYHLG
jgi:hypothetical protein